MTDRDERIDEALAKLKRVDDRQLDSLTDGRAAHLLFEEVVSMDRQQPTQPTQQVPVDRARRRRRTLAWRATIAAAAVAVVVGVLSVVNPFGSHGVTIVEQAAAALSPAKGTIVHMKMLGRQTNPDGSVVTWSDESWQATSAPFDRRQIEVGPDGTSVESASVDGLSQLYDAAADTIYVETPTPSDSAAVSAALPSPLSASIRVGPGDSLGPVTMRFAKTVDGKRVVVTKVISFEKAKPYLAKLQGESASAAQDEATYEDPFRAEILDMLRSGAAHEDGHLMVDGREAIRFVATVAEPGQAASIHETYLVDARTYDPIEWRTQGDGGGVVLRFVVYEKLADTATSQALLSLIAQHPDARVDRDPAHFREASSRLFPNG